jgi:hypothetical protein
MNKRLILPVVLVGTCLFSMRSHGEKPFIDWQGLKNPVYSHEGWSVKDACMTYNHGTFYIFFSAFYFDAGRETCHVVGVKTSEFKTFSEPLFIWRGEEEGWIGMASPDIKKIGDTYYLTYNSWGDKKGQPNQLFYATSKDLEHWEYDLPLASNITRGKRAIDAAIAHYNGNYYLQWKEFQRPKIAWSTDMGATGWHRIGWVPGHWFENAELIRIDGSWNIIATCRLHQPCIREMKGDGSEIVHWKRWTWPRRLDIPMEEFNTDNIANAAFLADWREYDGYFYLIYGGRTEGQTHFKRGNNKLGLARSRDLIVWEVP